MSGAVRAYPLKMVVTTSRRTDDFCAGLQQVDTDTSPPREHLHLRTTDGRLFVSRLALTAHFHSNDNHGKPPIGAAATPDGFVLILPQARESLFGRYPSCSYPRNVRRVIFRYLRARRNSKEFRRADGLRRLRPPSPLSRRPDT